MADATARQRYVDDRRLVECKQKARKGSAAHHEHVGAKSETGEATVTRVDDHSGHGGASYVGDGVPVAVVDEMVTQQSTKHLGNMAQ